MKRLRLIDKLVQVQENIEAVELQINAKMPEYYISFSSVDKWHHIVDIRKKALAYWKRRFNRIILQLGYYL